MGLVVGGVVAGAGALMGASAARKAGSQQANAIQQGVDFAKGVYGTEQANLTPFIGTGQNALASLAQLYGLPAPAGTNLPAGNALSSFNAFTQTPFYQFPLQQGLDTLNASGAARGLTLSGGQLNALQKYGQGYAASGFQNYINALAGLANLGQGSATALGSAGNQAGGTALGGQTNIGSALAAGTVGAQNQINNALGAVPSILGFGGANSSSYGNNRGGGLTNALGNLFGVYTGPSAGSLVDNAGNPVALQGALGLASNQYVP